MGAGEWKSAKDIEEGWEYQYETAGLINGLALPCQT